MIILIFTVLFIFNHNTYSNILQPKPTDTSFKYNFDLPENTYHKYCKNIYSQNGEDGILQQLLKELEIENGTFCEFGVSDGILSSNTYNLIKNYNFRGIAIESDESKYKQCVQTYKVFTDVQVFYGAVLYNDKNSDLNFWLKKGNLPYDFDILSIDIDSDDYYIWENLTEFNPKIVIIETNSYRDPIFEELPGKASNEYNIDLLKQFNPGRIASGCSFISAINLGLKKGYIPVAYTGNITFVRKDLVHQLKDFPYKVSDNSYDYINLYTHLALWNSTWETNTILVLNTAIRDYYLKFKRKYIDLDWLNNRMQEIINNQNVIF